MALEKTPTLDEEAHINLVDLSVFLRSNRIKEFKLDTHHFEIIEEVVFLCANTNFVNDINKIRKKILKKYPRLPLPVSNYIEAEYVLKFIYTHFYSQYKNLVEEILKKYKRLPNMYWQDKFLFLESKVDDIIKKGKFCGNKVGKKEALFLAMEEMTDNINLELIDSLIIRNAPFQAGDGFPFWVNPFLTRKTAELGGITVNLRKGPINLIEIGFPPYATLTEMKELLTDQYEKIQEYRNKTLFLPIKRDHRKDNLPKMIDAHTLNLQGKSDEEIAIILDAKYGGDITFEAVRQLIKRMGLEADKFSHKQKT